MATEQEHTLGWFPLSLVPVLTPKCLLKLHPKRTLCTQGWPWSAGAPDGDHGRWQLTAQEGEAHLGCALRGWMTLH